MRVVLDECLPKRLTRELAGHEARTVQQMGWSGISNGKLLYSIRGQFDAFITVDSNLAYQQICRIAGGRSRVARTVQQNGRPSAALTPPAGNAGCPQAGRIEHRGRPMK